MNTPSFKEYHISQLPALKLLMNMGWKYLSPEQALEARARELPTCYWKRPSTEKGFNAKAVER